MVAPTMPQFTKTSCDSQHFVTCNRDELPIIDNNGINCRNGLVVREPVTWIGRWEAIAFSTPFWNWSVENLYVTHRWSATGFNCISPTGKLISNSLLGSTRLGRRQTDRIVVPVFPHSSRTVAGVVSSGGSKITEIVVSFRIRCGFEAESTMSLAVLWQW